MRECCQTSHSKQNVVRARNIVVLDEKKTAYSKNSRRNDDQAGREHRSVHNGLVDRPRRNRSSFQLAGIASGQTAFDKPARPAALCRDEVAEKENEKILRKQNLMEKTECQMK